MNYPPGISGQPAPKQRAIEVGAAADDLDYWKAKEAMRHAELRLGAQAGSLRAAETRATSLIGWASVIASAGVAFATGSWGTLLGTPPSGSVSAVTQDLTGRMGAAWFLVAGSLACICCALWSIWPQRFYLPGQHPRTILDLDGPNELALLRRLAGGYGNAMTDNTRRLARAAWWLRAAYVALLAGIALAGVVMIWPRLPRLLIGFLPF